MEKDGVNMSKKISKGERIKELREAKGLSQDELAKMLNISKQAVGKYEKNIVTNIPSDRVESMAIILGSTPEYIMGWEKEKAAAEERGSLVGAVAKDEDLQTMLKMYMALPEDKKKTVKRMIEDYYNAYA